jgi:proteasome lid subunit RPN8/RPN11
MNLPESVLADIRAHAARDFPRESCGVIVVVNGKPRYVPCRNVAAASAEFEIHAGDWADAEDLGAVTMVVHSHPNLPPQPSQADLTLCEQTGLPWLIINWPTGALHEFTPTGWKAPLIGRHFHHGVLDCLTLIQDYYRDTVGITLPAYEREDYWWLKGQNLYLDLYHDCGFDLVENGPPRLHDVLLMMVGARVPNHGAIWLGDGCILHHQMGRLSSRDVYGGWYQKITTHTLRHRELCA